MSKLYKNQSQDIFVKVVRILDSRTVLVRVINSAGVPYSIILQEDMNGEFQETYNTPTNGDNGCATEEEMVKSYLHGDEGE